MGVRFEEKQRFTQWWLWVLLIAIALIPAYGVYRQIILGEPFGNVPLPDIGLILFLLFTLMMIGLFWITELRTTIDNEAIRIKYVPLTSEEFKWQDIVRAEIVNYGFVGGYGIRLGTQYGTVYNTRGKMGLAIELKKGKKYCIGTQREEELRKLLEEARRQQKV